MTTIAMMYFSRARLRHDAPLSALRELLASAEGTRTVAGHRLVWSLFADDPDRSRDFLWREAEPGTFYLLSDRVPVDRHGIFDLDPPRQFSPRLEKDQRLRFALRVNATISRKSEGKPAGGGRVRGGRCDIIMDALHALPGSDRAEHRRELLPKVAYEWLARQGEKSGFRVATRNPLNDWAFLPTGDEDGDVALSVMGYRVMRIDRGRNASPMEIGVLDLEGEILVDDSERLLAEIRRGFGRAKAFGCGLMLIRRAT